MKQTKHGKEAQVNAQHGDVARWLYFVIKLMREYERDVGVWNESYDISLPTRRETSGK